ncbi:MAG: hypothetical protein ACK5O2_15405 [Microthrixaceae bacterium]
MKLDEMANVVRGSEGDPDAEMTMAILSAAEQENGLAVLVTEALSSRREWSIRLAAIAVNRLASMEEDDALPHVAVLFFELGSGVLELDDDAATQTWLNAAKWLNETGRLRPRGDDDRDLVLEVLWRALVRGAFNTRESGLDTLTSIHDFGDLVDLLGRERISKLRQRIRAASTDARREVVDDLQAAERLLP